MEPIWNEHVAYLALHLLIMQLTTQVLVPSNTLLNFLWVTTTKIILFRNLLHINAVRRFGGIHWMGWQLPSIQSCQGYPPLWNSLYSVTSSGNALLTWPCLTPPILPSKGMVSLELHWPSRPWYNTWQYYLIQFM